MSEWQSRQPTPQNYLKVLKHLNEEYERRLGSNSVQLVVVCGSDFLDSIVSPNFNFDQQLELSNEEVF